MKKFFVFGLGRFGSHLARKLFQEGHEVVAIDVKQEQVQHLSREVTQAIVLDGTDTSSINELGLDGCDACIVATGSTISTSILICSMLSEVGVGSIVAKAKNEEHAKVLTKVGATEVIFPERDSALRLASTLGRPNLVDYLPLGEGIELQQIEAPQRMVGKDLRSLNLRAKYGVHLVAVKEENASKFSTILSAEYVIGAKSTLVLIGKQEDLSALQKNLEATSNS